MNKFLYLCINNQTMTENIIETIRDNFQFESFEQYESFSQMAQEFLTRELIEELNNENQDQ